MMAEQIFITCTTAKSSRNEMNKWEATMCVTSSYTRHSGLPTTTTSCSYNAGLPTTTTSFSYKAGLPTISTSCSRNTVLPAIITPSPHASGRVPPATTLSCPNVTQDCQLLPHLRWRQCTTLGLLPLILLALVINS